MDEENPLWLPAGSIRAILAILSIVGAIVLMYQTGELSEWMMTLVASIIGYYFGTRGATTTN